MGMGLHVVRRSAAAPLSVALRCLTRHPHAPALSAVERMHCQECAGLLLGCWLLHGVARDIRLQLWCHEARWWAFRHAPCCA